MKKKIEVCILLEGSYPFITGGVSAWVHDLIKNLPMIDFKLFTISPEANQELRYELPDNIIEHKDIILTEPPKSAAQPRKKKNLLKGIAHFHRAMRNGGFPDIKKLITEMPEGYHLGQDAVNSKSGWNLITQFNLKMNPLYAFSDYFWAWKSAHNMLFTTLKGEAPKADIYHAVSTGFAGMAALAAKLRNQKPFLLTEHGLYHKEREMEIRKAQFVRGYQRDMWTKMYNTISKYCYANADLITALFELNRRMQIDLGARPDNTLVIPNGIDIERYSQVKKVKKEGYHIGLVGRMVPIKDIKTFIAMAKVLREEIPEAHFYAIGPTDEDPEYYEECVKLVASLQLESCFTFTGRADVREYYSFLDVLLLTSVREAQPLVILEAYASLVPVVSTKVGNVAEMLDYDERLLASPKDAYKLAQGVLTLYNNPEETARMNKRNKQKVYDFYDKKDLHRRFHEIYRELVQWQE